MIGKLRLTRDLVNKLPSRVDERGPIRLSDPEPEYYDQTAAQILGRLQKPDELWVFAVGSLIWNPRMEVAERKTGLVKGWHRSFCLGPDLRYRGNPAAPGRMLSLEKGGECHGVALRMAPTDLAGSLVELLKVEPPLPPEWVEVETETGVIPAIAFTVCKDFLLYAPEPPEDELADILAGAVGHVGSMADYVLNTVFELEKVGIHDPHLWRIQDRIAERLERMPEHSLTDT
ncbi:MAG: cation transport protein ChaC [Paracoccaceae bacterium]|jgi:cation transport protein ChaC